MNYREKVMNSTVTIVDDNGCTENIRNRDMKEGGRLGQNSRVEASYGERVAFGWLLWEGRKKKGWVAVFFFL